MGIYVPVNVYTPHNCEEPLCDEETEVELWGWCYNIEETTSINLLSEGLIGEIPSEIGNLINLEVINLYNNELSGEIPQEVCDLIESNDWVSWWNFEDYILEGHNLTNTCDD